MPSEIRWLPAAARDVARLRAFIQEKNPTAARKAAGRIKEGAMILSENPETGRPIEDLLPFRDLMIPFGSGNYVMRYRIEEHRVVIVRVWHSREERG